MKLTALFLAALFLLMGCGEDPQNPASPVPVDTVEVNYLPTKASVTVSLGGDFSGFPDSIPTDTTFDTLFSDTAQLLGLTGDSLILYTHDEVTTSREATSRANPLWDDFTPDAALLEPWFTEMGFTVNSIKESGSSNSINVEGPLFTMISVKNYALDIVEFPIVIPLTVTAQTDAREFEGVVPPLNWPPVE